ncbi:simple sugar transport system ATP-binding protein [Caldanaerobacter subterraneus subsp. tengcongensis MB4]|uniref:ABC-type sugar (Aldose) transport system, ATPase component n=3 Tax=Caldanaerobacter subterraneus TaxID=911092 RepID=Q8RCH1_CALS4|nr:ABC transporter ATP-binding protein [Caldanaerobacter subterraneus]AAM23741.1 ABC-type sugar (aldose) transport system, ATPase component [Caldanaerobacter subterraneus subsp. tengcongensis MB4]KKC30467.1 ABC-type sugar (aldose) transport system, ATPase component [Caldanaerobacter subterraneus subsp. pacificus DSM 12653]MCS3916764.1 simple sugar transport system ATP-binding protein [Caldanaerobacter subterraneus subsp. tengcongensis MB4]NNG67282.1 ABC transporter ATP-binding protein [Caldanae
MSAILEVRNITKRFPKVVANDNVNLTVERGEIHAILGENGAGKSTLMNIIYGLYKPDSGQLIFDGEELNLSGPHEAIEKGIGMVHQHFMLIPVFTVAENIVLGAEPKGITYDRKKANELIREISEKYHLEIDPDAKVKDLSVGLQQRVEILKAFYRKAKLLILDEPTAMLTPQETQKLFEIMRELKQQGMSIIFISHKLEEVLEISDRVTVMRRGKTVGTLKTKETNEQELANLMVGREVVLRIEKSEYKPGDVVLSVKNLTVVDQQNVTRVKDVSFEIREGEIFGLAGIDGNGQLELVEAIMGLRPKKSGSVFFYGKDVTNFSTRQLYREGISYIPQDRQADGLVLDFTIAENLILREYKDPTYSRRGVIQYKKVYENAEKKVKEFDVRPPEYMLKARNLSGGNQQKVILAREVGYNPKLLIAVQPTRGMDVGAIEYIHRRILELRDKGAAIFLVSLELEEIMSLSDRIGVIYKGQLMDILDGKTATKEQIGLLMAGSRFDKTTLEAR